MTSRFDVQRASILMIEPDITLARVAADFLTTSGFTVRYVESEEDAIEVASHAFPHLIVVDIGVPEPDGIAFLEEIRRLESGANPYVAATSIYPITRSMLRLNRIDAFLQKPYSVQNLLWTVQDGIALLKSKCEG